MQKVAHLHDLQQKEVGTRTLLLLGAVLLLSLYIAATACHKVADEPTVLSGSSEQPVVAEPEAPTALRALERATAAATKWKSRCSLIEVRVNSWEEREPEEVWAHRNGPGPNTLPVESVEVPTTSQSPRILSWGFFFKSGPAYRRIIVSASDIKAEDTNSPPQDADALPIVNWAIDSDKAVSIAQNAGGTRTLGPLVMKMRNVNGEWIPAWSIPFVLSSGDRFIVRGDTGQIFVSTDREDYTKFAPYEVDGSQSEF